MNFKYLVDSGKYSKEDLTEKQQEFICGIEEAKETIETFRNNYSDYVDSDIPTLKAIICEIAEKLLDCLQEYLDVNIAEWIVSLADCNATEADSKGG